MKKGKTSQIDGFDNAKITYGTVDSVNLKSIYLNIQTWVEPITEVEDWNRIVLNLSRNIKHSIYEVMNEDVFTKTFIVDLDLRSSGLSILKKSFMNLEINLFLNEPIDFKSLKLKKTLKLLVKEIYSDVLINNPNFKFYLTKTGNVKPIKVKTETA